MKKSITLIFLNNSHKKFFFLAFILLIGIQNYKAQATTDSDGDGVADQIDLDDDNDGIIDCEENNLNKSIDQVFKLNGNASFLNGTEIQLTPNTYSASGNMWSYGKVDFARNFNFSFEAYLGTDDNGADGIAIVFQNSPLGTSTTGTNGGGLGAGYIQNGIVLELDTYPNPNVDPIADHGQIWKSSDQSALTSPIELPNLEDGQWHQIQINWDTASQTISYTVDGTLAGSYTGNLVTNYFGGSSWVHFGCTASTGGAKNDQRVRISSICSLPIVYDTDGDGIINSLDLDSDNDGCPDALEGSASIVDTQLVNSSMPGGNTNTTSGNYNLPIVSNLCTSNICVNSVGLPQLTTPVDYNNTTGQGIGDSQNSLVNMCFCYNDANTSVQGKDSQHGITLLQRAGDHDGDKNKNWPMIRKSAHTVLESNSKGFVITRMSTSQIAAITNPVEGMMVYDTIEKCLKIYDGTQWSCFSKRACP